jgi:nitrate/nitrite-specific signal transduction histidine kinase
MRTATRSHSLRTKILAWSLIPTLLALGAIALVSHFAYQAMARDLVLDRDRELTRLLAEQLGSQLADYAGTPENLSRAEGVYEQEIVSERSLFRRLVTSIRPRTGEAGIAYLVNADGEAILHSDRTRVGESLSGVPAVEAVLAGESGAQRARNDSGLEILTSYAPVPGTTWGLVIEQPWSSLTASITSYQRAILALMTGGLVLMGTLVLLGVRRTTGPLRDLVSALRAISEGDFQTRVTAATGDEIETLAAQFNRMSARLQESYHALARRASRRERELATLNEVTAASSLARELPDVLSESLTALDRTLGFEAAAIWTVDEGADRCDLAAGHGDADALQSLVTSPDANRLRTELLGREASTAAADAPILIERAEGGILVGVPVVARGRRLGMLGVVMRDEQAPGSEQAQLLTTVGRQLGLAMESHQLFADASRRADLFRLIADVGGHITSILSLPELMNAIVESIHQRIGYERVAIGLIEDGRVTMKAGAGGVWDHRSGQPPSFVVGEQGLIGYAAASGKSLLVPDVLHDSRYVPLADSEGTCSELVVPLRTGELVLGVLDVQSDCRQPFTEIDRTVLESLAAQAAIAIQNARLAERSHEMAVLEERTRIAHDLHDAVSQTLWTAGLVADVLPTLWRSNRVEGQRSLRQLQRLTHGALSELRMLLLELRPAALASADLGDLLKHLADGTTSRKNLTMRVSVDGRVGLPVDVKIGLYRIAQEAVSNVVKHACATRVTIALETQGDAVRMQIEDNGCARKTAPDPGSTPGLGMDIMRERAVSIGARMQVERIEEGGTRVQVTWPERVE